VFDTAERNQGLGNPPATVRKEVYTLPERLAKAGYDTYFMSAIVTAELPIRGRFNKATVEHDARADVLVNGLLEWWDDAAGPRFGYVQLGDLHAPLARPEKMPFGSVPDIQNVDRWDFTTTTEPREEFETYREARIRLYDSNLRFVDEQLRRLFAALSERDELEDTLILITGDHGEEFWERVALERQHFDDPRGVYGTGHGHALIPEVLFVPLVIHGSDLTASEDWTSTVDITPTVLTELGATEQALEGFDGVALQKTPPDNRAVLAEEIAYGYDQQAVVRGEHHLIDSPHEAASVLLDLSTGEPVVDDAVEAELRMLMPTEKHHGETATIDTETQERLADLGYL
jgi:arylsulfatase A-like enzyme